MKISEKHWMYYKQVLGLIVILIVGLVSLNMFGSASGIAVILLGLGIIYSIVFLFFKVNSVIIDEENKQLITSTLILIKRNIPLKSIKNYKLINLKSGYLFDNVVHIGLKIVLLDEREINLSDFNLDKLMPVGDFLKSNGIVCIGIINDQKFDP